MSLSCLRIQFKSPGKLNPKDILLLRTTSIQSRKIREKKEGKKENWLDKVEKMLEREKHQERIEKRKAKKDLGREKEHPKLGSAEIVEGGVQETKLAESTDEKLKRKEKRTKEHTEAETTERIKQWAGQKVRKTNQNINDKESNNREQDQN